MPNYDLGEIDLIGPPTDAPAVYNFGSVDLVHEGVPMMNEQEARAVVTRIKTRIDITRGELLELHDREGWRALGYSSWGTCVKAEFEGSSTALYRQLAAAKIERDVFGDSRIGNPVPASQLEAVKDLPTEQKRAAFKRADELAGDQPRTTKHITQAAAESSAPDLPPDFAIVQRRLATHGVALTHKTQNGVLLFVWQTGAGRPISTMEWRYIQEKIAFLEEQAVWQAAQSGPAGWVCEGCGARITDMKRPLTPICATCEIRRQADRQARPGPVPPLADLDATLPDDLNAAGYYWQSDSPPTIARNGSAWRGDAQTAEGAIELARDREKASTSPLDRRLTPGAHAQALTLLISIRTDLITYQTGQAELHIEQLRAIVSGGTEATE